MIAAAENALGAAESPPGEVSILFLGDSLTAGYQIALENSYPSQVAAKARAEGFNVSVTNAGISGETSAGGLRRIDWLLRRNYDIFLLALGANDGLRGLPVDETKQNLIATIKKVREKSPQTVIFLAGMLTPPTMGREYADSFRAIFPALAEETGVTLIPFLLEGVAGEPEYNLEDGIHPNKDGYQIIAANVWQHLAPAVEKVAANKKSAGQLADQPKDEPRK